MERAGTPYYHVPALGYRRHVVRVAWTCKQEGKHHVQVEQHIHAVPGATAATGTVAFAVAVGSWSARTGSGPWSVLTTLRFRLCLLHEMPGYSIGILHALAMAMAREEQEQEV
jgi:hypothetical protein